MAFLLMAIQKEKERFRETKKRAQVSLTRTYSHEATLMPLWLEPCLRNLRPWFAVYGSSTTVALRAACAPITSTCAMSAVFDGPLMNVP